MIKKQIQLQRNVELVLDEYYNGMCDYPEDYGEMTIEACHEYVIGQIYNMKNHGGGYVQYRNGICDDLKTLGNAYIFEVIDKYAVELGIIKIDEPEESETKEAGYELIRKRSEWITGLLTEIYKNNCATEDLEYALKYHNNREILDEILRDEGIIGYTRWIIALIEDIYGIKLTEELNCEIRKL